jgi:hypothetical protein
MARKGGALPLLLAGLAAWGYYKYSKMSEDQKRNLVSDWKEKGKTRNVTWLVTGKKKVKNFMTKTFRRM